MNRIARGALMVFVVVEAAWACHKAPPPPPPAPAPFNEDSARRARDAAAAEQRRRDSLAEAQATAARARARADSIAAATAAADAAARASATRRATLGTVIIFNYDAAELTPDARTLLEAKAPILSANPSVRIRIDGNTDERGSDEYNLALGQRRAEAAKQYLVQRGVSADRIDTRSLGEESPVANAHDETSWAQNRRDDFVILVGGETLR